MKKIDPLNDPVARAERKAARQEAAMRSFFGGLSASMRRKMKRAQKKVTGKRSIADILGASRKGP